MRDVSTKILTLRKASAKSILHVSPQTIRRIELGDIPKGNPLEVAKIAAIQAAKKTQDLIPYCHQIPIDHVDIHFELTNNSIEITADVTAIYKTGVEMEAMTAASVAALCMYDMLKMIDDNMEIANTRLTRKQGGKSELFDQEYKHLKAAVLVMSDTVSSGKGTDISGRIITNKLQNIGIKIVDYSVVADDPDQIENTIKELCDDKKVDLVVTTGGTGVGLRDNTPEVVAQLIDKEIPGIAETIRRYGQDRTPFSMLSRSIAGLRNKTLIVCLPGSKSGVQESLEAIFPGILHTFSLFENGQAHHHAKVGAKKSNPSPVRGSSKSSAKVKDNAENEI
jgi:molybdenum cofactor biosynthesis protein MoaC